MTERIKKAIIRYITSSATAKDLEELSEWVKIDSNKKEFESFIKDYYAITYSINNSDTDRAVYKLMYEIKKRKEHTLFKKRRKMMYYAAAALVLCISIGSYLFRENIFNTTITVVANQGGKAGTDKAILTLSDGSEIQLGQKEVFEEEYYESTGTKLAYFSKRADDEAIVYHNLTVPRGGKFMIELADGTKVWLNSDTQIKYPTKFKKGESRTVQLLYGEAYFDVSPATKHGGANFKVFNNEQEVQVLGTEFNIKAYADENDIYTTLVEGKVVLNYEDKTQDLTPGQQAVYKYHDKVMTTKMIDVYNETSWKEGVFSFDNKPLGEIMTVLSRWYDIEFKFLNKETQNEEFIGVLSKNQDIEEILSQIKHLGIINNYKIESNEITIE